MTNGLRNTTGEIEPSPAGFAKWLALGPGSVTPVRQWELGAPAEISVVLEMPVQPGTTETNEVIPTGSGWTAVKVRTRVVGAPSGPPSQAYLAARRRGQCTKILKLIRGLGAKADRPDFHIWTHEPLTLLKRLIRFIDDGEEHSDIEYEGNACEVLRQIRDSFLRRGWERYRETGVRIAVESILRRLSTADVITPDVADESMGILLGLGLEPVLAPLGGGDGEDSEAHN